LCSVIDAIQINVGNIKTNKPLIIIPNQRFLSPLFIYFEGNKLPQMCPQIQSIQNPETNAKHTPHTHTHTHAKSVPHDSVNNLSPIDGKAEEGAVPK